MSRTGPIAIGLTALDGYVDVPALIRLGGVYTSFMSGDATQVAVITAQAEPCRLLLFGFPLGEIIAIGLAILVSAPWATPVVLAYGSRLILGARRIGLASPELGLASPFMATAMGSQNAVLSQVKGLRAGTTFVTGALFSVGQRIAQAPTRSGGPLGWMGDGLVWLSLLLCASFGALAYERYELYALVPPTAVAGGLALVTTVAIACSASPSKVTTS